MASCISSCEFISSHMVPPFCRSLPNLDTNRAVCKRFLPQVFIRSGMIYLVFFRATLETGNRFTDSGLTPSQLHVARHLTRVIIMFQKHFLSAGPYILIFGHQFVVLHVRCLQFWSLVCFCFLSVGSSRILCLERVTFLFFILWGFLMQVTTNWFHVWVISYS